MTLSAASEPQNDTVLIAEGREFFLPLIYPLRLLFFCFFSTGRVWLALGERLTEPRSVNLSSRSINLLATQPDKTMQASASAAEPKH